jgi:hypothetical protein
MIKHVYFYFLKILLNKKRYTTDWIILNESISMATNEQSIDISKILSILSNEEELIIKPFQSGKFDIIIFELRCFSS